MDCDKETSLRTIIHQVTAEKLQKLRAQKETLTNHFTPTLKKIEGQDHLENLKELQKSLLNCPIKDFGNNEEVAQLRDLDVLIRLAETDPSAAGTYDQTLQYWVRNLAQQIRFKLQRCEYSYLYGSIMNEYLDVTKTSNENPDVAEDMDNKNESKEEMIKGLRDRIFEPSKVNKDQFRTFLREKVFNFEEFEEKTHFKKVWDATEQFGRTFHTHPVNTDDLIHCIKGLYSVDLLSGEKKATLRELEQNNVALAELATLLTDYVANIGTWNWPAPVVIDFRRNMAGKYRAFMDEDIVTALFLQYVGVQWAIHFKSIFLRIYNNPDIWKRGDTPIKSRRGNNPIEKQRRDMHQGSFLSVLPTKMNNQYTTYDGENASSDAKNSGWTSPVNVKQRLLHIISNEMHLNKAINPESPITVVQTDMEWFGPSLSHDAILILMEVLGVQQQWINFFRRFLEAPLIIEGPHSQPKIRKRGVAISHLLSTLFGESLLFVLDFYVNKSSGILLHRIHDDFWFWDHRQEQAVKAWEAMQEFVNVSGLKLNMEKSGSITVPSRGTSAKDAIFGQAPLPQKQVKWGFLELFSDGIFRINLDTLTPHIEEMTKILSQAPTVVHWVNIYNKYMAFFFRNFGKCALTFGPQHIQRIIEALQHINSQVFKATQGNPLKHLQNKFQILKRDDLLDGWVYWPVKEGGLGLRNYILGMVSLLKTYQDIKEELSFSLLPEQDKSIWKNLIKASEERRQKTKYKRPAAMTNEEMLTDSEFSDNDYEDEQEGLTKVKRMRRYINFENVCKKSREYRWYHWGEKYAMLLKSPEEDAPRCPRYYKDKHWLPAIYGGRLNEYFGTDDFINTKLIPVSLISIMKSSRLTY